MELDTEGTYDGHQTGFDDGTLRLYFKKAASIKAGMPYLIKNSSNSNITKLSFAGVLINSDAPKAVTSADGKVTFMGAYSPVAITAEDRSILYLGAENTLYYPEAEMTIGSCRAHFELNGITAGDQNTEVRSYELNFGEGATNSIDNVQRSLFTVQRSTFNVPSEAWFSLDGRRLNGKPSQPGVYINNGRKIMVK